MARDPVRRTVTSRECITLRKELHEIKQLLPWIRKNCCSPDRKTRLIFAFTPAAHRVDLSLPGQSLPDREALIAFWREGMIPKKVSGKA
jgi:hypothetical protein